MPSSSASVAPLRVVLVEDQKLDAELILQELARAGYHALTTRIETADEFARQLATDPDVILCDYALPTFSAPEALRMVQQRQLDIPFIVISGSIGEETAVDAIKNGADDYLLKDRLGRLGSAVSQAIEEKKLRATAHRAEEDLRQSEYKYRCLFEHLPDGAFLCDSATGRIIDTNRRGEQLLGLERSSVLGMRLSQFLPAGIFKSLLAVGQTESETGIELEADLNFAPHPPKPVTIHASVVSISRRRLLLTFLRERRDAKPSRRVAQP